MWGRATSAARAAMLRNVVAQPQGPADADRAGALSSRPGRPPAPAAVANLRPYRLPGTRARIGFATSLPAFAYGDPPRGRRPVLGHRAVLHALPGQARREPRDPGRGQPGRVDRPRRRRDRAVAAAVVDDLDLAGGQRSVRALRLQRHPDDGRQPRRPRFDGQSAITQRGLRGHARLPLHRQRALVARRGPARPARRGGPKPQFLALAPVGGPRRPARPACARSAAGSRSAPGARSRTTTSRPRSSPTCRSRPTHAGPTA